jgi:hypothetical protein
MLALAFLSRAILSKGCMANAASMPDEDGDLSPLDIVDLQWLLL